MFNICRFFVIACYFKQCRKHGKQETVLNFPMMIKKALALQSMCITLFFFLLQHNPIDLEIISVTML